MAAPTLRQAHQLPLSALAKKYNHPVGDGHNDLYGSSELKSGLTPLNLGPFNKFQDLDNFQRWKRYQKGRFEGFLTNELEAMDSLAPLCHDPQMPALESVPIHPLLTRKQWYMKLGKHQAPYPFKRGSDDFWHAANDKVWNAMIPALKVASLYLTAGPLLAWIDSLFFGQLEQVGRIEVPDEQDFHTRRFYRIRCRRPDVVQAHRNSVLAKLISVAKNVELGLVSGLNDTLTGVPDRAGITLGRTCFNMKWFEKTKVFIALEMVEPLLRADLTAAERAVETFRLASIIMHEIAHVLWLERAPDRTTRHANVDEPYYEDEVSAELGFSFQNALLGGIPHEFVSMEDPRIEFGIPAGGIYKSSWDNVTFHNYNRYAPTLLKLPPNYFRRDRWPVPVGFFLNLGQQRYWDTFVRKFGQKATRMGPLSQGSREEFAPSDNEARQLLTSYEPIPQLVDVGPTLPETDQTLARFHNQRILRARRVRDQLQDHARNVRTIEEAQLDMIVTGHAARPPSEELPKYPSCARYMEIRDYLFRNRLELALDTLNFKMPEHVMFAYILRNGGLDLLADEWRDFLQYCEFHKFLFKHTKLGTGYLERIWVGWPTTALRPYPTWPKPERSIREHFIVVARAAISLPYVFRRDFLDHDKYHFRQICIASPENHTPVPERRRICEFEPALFEALLFWCHREKHLFTYGPEGVIRLLKNQSNLPNDPPPYDDEKNKGTKTHTKRCPQM